MRVSWQRDLSLPTLTCATGCVHVHSPTPRYLAPLHPVQRGRCTAASVERRACTLSCSHLLIVNNSFMSTQHSAQRQRVPLWIMIKSISNYTRLSVHPHI